MAGRSGFLDRVGFSSLASGPFVCFLVSCHYVTCNLLPQTLTDRDMFISHDGFKLHATLSQGKPFLPSLGSVWPQQREM